MHELSIAMSVVEMAEEELERCGGARITIVRLRVGALAGVVKEALVSSYELAIENTLLAGSQLVIEEVPGVIFCFTCQKQRDVKGTEWFRCFDCGSLSSEIVRGKELEVVSLEVQQ